MSKPLVSVQVKRAEPTIESVTITMDAATAKTLKAVVGSILGVGVMRQQMDALYWKLQPHFPGTLDVFTNNLQLK